MNKTLLLAGIATTLFAVNANAVELNPYVSAKAAFVKMENDANVNSDYSYWLRNKNYWLGKYNWSGVGDL